MNRWLPWLGATVALAILVGPILTKQNPYVIDWSVHLWMGRHQGYSLLHDWRPSLFAHSEAGVFYPVFAFSGGTLYVIGGLLMAVLGGAGTNGYAVTWVLAYVMAYGGWVWLGRMAGLGPWAVQAPPIAFLSSPYIFTLVYSRGAWPEFVAVCTMPLLIASVLSVVREDRVRLGPGIGLVVSSVLFTGSHNLTLLWGGSLMAVLALLVLMCSGQARRWPTRKGLLTVAGLMLPAVMVNAWFLAPDLAYSGRTVIATLGYTRWQFTVAHTMEYMYGQPLFTLKRFPGAYVLTLPVLAMAWPVLVAGLSLPRMWRSAWTRIFILLVALVVLLIAGMLTHGRLILPLPKPYVMIQYTYRLENYILLGVAGGVLVALVLVRGAGLWVRTLAYASLVVVIALSLAGARQQISAPSTVPASANAFWDPDIDSIGDYADGTMREYAAAQPRRIDFPPEQVRGNRITVTEKLRPGDVVDTNLMVMPELVRLGGARILIGHSEVEGSLVRRYAVLEITGGDARSEAIEVTVRAARPWPVVAGEILTLLGLLGLAANVVLRRPWRRRQRPARSISSTR